MPKDNTYCVELLESGRYLFWQYASFYKTRRIFDTIEQCMILCDLMGADLIDAPTGKYLKRNGKGK